MGKQESRARNFARYVDSMTLGGVYDFTDKKTCVSQHIAYMLARTQQMFTWENLPDTIPARMLELYLQTNGNVCFYKHEGDLYVFTGGLGGEPDVYYMPTIYTIANPALNLTVNAVINRDCIVMPSDSLYMGMLPMYHRYATGMTENELSMKIAMVNSRLSAVISAQDDRTKASAEKYLKDLEEGKQGIIGETAFLDGVRVQPYGNTGNTNILTNLIENEQYLKASWYNEIGLNANYNMKRESLNSAESQLNNDALLPLVDDMLACRQKGIEKVNSMFGTNISVRLASSWQDNQQEIDLEQDAIDPAPDDSGQPETSEGGEEGDVERDFPGVDG